MTLDAITRQFGLTNDEVLAKVVARAEQCGRDPVMAIIDHWRDIILARLFAQEDGTIMIESGFAHSISDDTNAASWWDYIP